MAKTFQELFGDDNGDATQHFDPRAVTLESAVVRLEPLALEHAEHLHAAGSVETLWRYMPIPVPRRLEDYRAWIGEALELAETGSVVPFAIVHIEDGVAVGSTRFLNIERENRGLEIGWTWIGIKYQQTLVNTHCKYVLLKHAFEDLGAIRVQLKTDSRNQQSRKSIERVGGKREGVLRNHMITHDGYYRDTVIYSFTLKDWPDKKKSLQLRLL